MDPEEDAVWLHPEMRTVPDIVRYWATRGPEKIAIKAGTTEVTYAELNSVANRLAGALVARGHQARHVAFVGKNVLEFWEVWFAAGKAGSPIVPINWRLAVPELVDLMNDSEASVVFVEREYAEAMEQVKSRCDKLREVVVFDSRGTGGRGLAPWASGVADADPAVPVTGEDIALLAYTSGTTGAPKGVMIRHEAFDLAHLSDDLEPTISWSADDVAMMVMPNFHLAGSWVSMPAFYHGGTLVLVAAFEPSAVLAAVQQHQPTVICLVPTAIQLLLDHPQTAETDFSSLRTLIYAGSAIGPSTLERALTVFRCDLRQFYGTTETYIISILRPADHDLDRPDLMPSCGFPIPLVDTRIVDFDGRDVPDGQVGQVLVHSPMMMAGYYNRPDETAEALRDGWFWTGDLGYRTEDGYHYLVDRAKDMVVSGGENVYSVEVERALQRHPDVAMAAVVGTPDVRWGEAVTAFVTARPDTKLDVESLRAHCRELIAGYKIPKIFHIEDGLPVTASGKVRKVDLRSKVRAQATSEAPLETPNA